MQKTKSKSDRFFLRDGKTKFQNVIEPTLSRFAIKLTDEPFGPPILALTVEVVEVDGRPPLDHFSKDLTMGNQ